MLPSMGFCRCACKNFKMGRLSWFISEAQCHHKGSCKRETEEDLTQKTLKVDKGAMDM